MAHSRWLPLMLLAGCGLVQATAGAQLRPRLPPRGRTAAELQIVTAVVSINVPAAAYDAATGQATVTIPRGLVLQVQSATSWILQLRATQPKFSHQPANGGTPSSKPASDLKLRNAAGGGQFAPTTAYVEIARGNSQPWREYAFDVTFPTSAAADGGGQYSLNLELQFR